MNFVGIGRVREGGMSESGGICLFLVGSKGWSRVGTGQDQHRFPIPGGKQGQWGLWLLEGTSSASERVRLRVWNEQTHIRLSKTCSILLTAVRQVAFQQLRLQDCTVLGVPGTGRSNSEKMGVNS